MDGTVDSPDEVGRNLLLEGELGRRLVHASGAVVPALYLVGLATWEQVTLLLVLGTAIVAVLELLRLSVGLDWIIYEYLTREYEQDGVAGYAYYMLSSAFVAALFDPAIAIPAMLMLMLADPVSGMLGSGEFRAIKRPRALTGMFLLSAAIALPFHFEAPAIAILGGLGSMLADGVKPVVRGFVVDDNLTIPPAAAAGMFLGMELLSF